MQQFRLGHQLRNSLVAVERDHAERVASIWAEHPDVGVWNDRLDAADTVVADLLARAKQERVADRSRVPRSETKDALRAAKKVRAEANASLKAARQAAYPTLRPAMAEAQSERRLALKGAGQDAKAQGLLWHTHDAVMASHETAAKAITDKRKAGQPAEFRFARWQGEGRIRVTLMRHEFQHGCGERTDGWPCGQGAPRDCPERQTHHPRRSPMLLTAEGGGGPWRNVICLPPHMDPEVCEADPPRHHGARETIRLRIGAEDGEPVWWELPVFVHRPIPPEGDITFVEVRRRRIAGSWRLSVSVSVRLPAVPTRIEGDVVGVDIGWRSVEGGLRVAAIASTGPLPPVPRDLVGVVRPLAGVHAVEVVVPTSWRDVMARTSGLRGVRDQALDIVRRKVVDALAEGVPEIEDTAADVARWRSPGRFAVLARRWPEAHPLAEDLEAWRKQDRHLWEWEAHERDQIIARRVDAYWKVAAWLLHDGVGAVIVENRFVASVVQVPDADEADDAQSVLARAQHQVAAPADLVSRIKIAAGQRGVRSVEVDPSYSTRTHVACGEQSEATDQFRDDVLVWCARCEVSYDQDVNAALYLIGTVGDLA